MQLDSVCRSPADKAATLVSVHKILVVIRAVLKHDVTNIHLTFASLAKAHTAQLAARKVKQNTLDKPPPLVNPLPPLRAQVWKKTYESILPNDSYGIATILDILVLISHLENPFFDGLYL